MLGTLKRYTQWLHTRWPAGEVEKLPTVKEDGSTNVPGLFIVGDLTGIPLLKFSSDTGARVVQQLLADPEFHREREQNKRDDIADLVIIGGGVSGMAAAIEAQKFDLRYRFFEASAPFSTIANFPKGKPIYTYPTDMTPRGDLQFTADIKEDLLAEMKAQTLDKGIQPEIARAEHIQRKGKQLEVHMANGDTILASKVIVAIGRSGSFRKLDVPGEERGKVSNRLHDPKEFEGKHVLIVGGGDSALEAAIALVQGGAHVTLSYRKESFSRPKPENIEKLHQIAADNKAEVAIETPVSERMTTASGAFMGINNAGSLQLQLGSQVQKIEEKTVTLKTQGGAAQTFSNDAVFTMLGREAPLDFFRRSGVHITGELRPLDWTLLALFFGFCIFLYNWKAGASLTQYFQQQKWFPFQMPTLLGSISTGFASMVADKSTFLGTLAITIKKPGFYYTLAYCFCVVFFGFKRIARRKTPYVRAQTYSLMLFQLIPLFLLPYIVLPYMGNSGWFDAGVGKSVADALFPVVNYGHGREYWRAFGLILAWPLFVWNVFTDQPMWWWLGISIVQTFVIIPGMVFLWGKGAYCGWVCSCGALAETLGDEHRHKMPHGAIWNRVNMLGQVVLWVAFLLLATRILSWTMPGTWLGGQLKSFYAGLLQNWKLWGVQLNYKWIVDVLLAGIVGIGLYFWYSGRVWCRFACPLAALMHIYARFSRFRIFAEKKKCISCNVCTTVCHQGIDIMNFANKGLPMEDPECVRCSACVQSCPTGVLQFGQLDLKTGNILALDTLAASPVIMAERTANTPTKRQAQPQDTIVDPPSIDKEQQTLIDAEEFPSTQTENDT
ncbi:MAG: iron-sulfur cluster-binding protein [Deltaproteobacteria bacterium]|nr:iron-sulfur cluster-binding protein [Deltaproteobacteria bacterium]MBU54506.1 iron-sulfur cluster-binding protein [Deltaproteobacteria bacterium]